LTKAADSFPEGGKEGFVEFLKGRCRIPRQPRTSGDISAAFSRSSEVIGGMLYYEPVWRAFLRRLASNLVQDGIYWAELRSVHGPSRFARWAAYHSMSSPSLHWHPSVTIEGR
jgi:adenosine deaminase CECR1